VAEGSFHLHTAAVLLALLTIAANAAAALVGAWAWRRFAESRAFWIALRAGQGAAILQAAFAGVAAAGGSRPDDGLYWLYAALPVAIGFLAEQLRTVAAPAELDRRGLPDAQAVGRLPEPEQRRIVQAILHRELGIMAVAAGVVCFLALRAVSTAAGL
jgi:hypothetical protein